MLSLKVNFNISNAHQDPDIIKEMISKVDVEKMQKIMSVASSHKNPKKVEVTMDIVLEYLHIWACAKYDYYILFGNKLFIDEEVEITMSNSEMTANIQSLCSQYPQYASLLNGLPPKAYIDNKVGGDFLWRRTNDELNNFAIDMLIKDYFSSPEKKLSTVLSEIIKDKGYMVKRTLGDGRVVESLHSFDIELSKAMQSKNIKGSIRVSIDPTDYLMMSTNKHNWISCMSMTPSCTGHNNTVLSKICDESTLVAYKCNNVEYDYSLNGFNFKHISMQSRFLLFFDKQISVCASDSGYGTVDDSLRNSVIDLMVKKVCEYKDLKFKDYVFTNKLSTSTYPFSLSYHETIVNTKAHKDIIGEAYPYYRTGVGSVICPACGKKMKQKGNFICCNKNI